MSAKRVKVKPGKAQSKMGFIAYSHYKNGFTDEGFPTHEIIIDEDELTSMREEGGSGDFAGEDIEARMKTLASLYDQGLITGEEYEAKRREILAEI